MITADAPVMIRTSETVQISISGYYHHINGTLINLRPSHGRIAGEIGTAIVVSTSVNPLFTMSDFFTKFSKYSKDPFLASEGSPGSHSVCPSVCDIVEFFSLSKGKILCLVCQPESSEEEKPSILGVFSSYDDRGSLGSYNNTLLTILIFFLFLFGMHTNT